MEISNSINGLQDAVRVLKGVAEPTRLRLMALLSHGELTVGEICEILGQSQPRVSRHLGLLSDAGLLDRLPEQQSVYYRTPAGGSRLKGLEVLLQHLEAVDERLGQDQRRMSEVVAARGRAAVEQLAPGAGLPLADADQRVLGQILSEGLAGTGIGELLDIGTGGGRMLQVLAPRASRALGVDISAPALRLARTRVHEAGMSHCEFQRGDMYALPCADQSFDTVSMDQVLAQAERPAAALAEAVRALRPGGRLIMIEEFDALDAAGGDNPLRRVRRWLAAAQLEPERLQPCDLAAGHFLVAVAHRNAPVRGS
ncbi:MAG: metalloregulator ArsR/SmtB family transcription factor [Steroidobacteraceae bacterium]|jgi:ArsR family transcriptional regulator